MSYKVRSQEDGRDSNAPGTGEIPTELKTRATPSDVKKTMEFSRFVTKGWISSEAS